MHTVVAFFCPTAPIMNTHFRCVYTYTHPATTCFCEGTGPQMLRFVPWWPLYMCIHTMGSPNLYFLWRNAVWEWPFSTPMTQDIVNGLHALLHSAKKCNPMLRLLTSMTTPMMAACSCEETQPNVALFGTQQFFCIHLAIVAIFFEGNMTLNNVAFLKADFYKWRKQTRMLSHQIVDIGAALQARRA